MTQANRYMEILKARQDNYYYFEEVRSAHVEMQSIFWCSPNTLDLIDYAFLLWTRYSFRRVRYEPSSELMMWLKLAQYDEKCEKLDRAIERESPGFFLRKRLWRERHDALMEKWPVLDG